MAGVNVIVGDDGSNTLNGTAGRDLVYGFDPNGPQGTVTSIAATRVASGLTTALFAAAPPGDTDRLFIVEQTGSIRVLDLNTGVVSATPFLSLPVDSSGERGLLGLAFDPDYATNGFFYVYHTVPGSPAHNQVDRYHVSANPNVADAASATPIISLDNLSGATNHNAGWIGFGPDGDLYIASGENANPPNAQTLGNLLGKILRIDVHSDAFPADPSANYAIPADNPFVGTAGARAEIFALGLRNPFRDSFDRGTGDFFIADVGQNTIEEINAGIKGANYGWPIAEGPSGGMAGLTDPIFFYDHTVGQAIIGGYVYRGPSEGLQGQYFFADEVAGKVFTMRFDGSTWVATDRTAQITTDAGAINNPTSFGEDGHGNLYLTDFDGDVFRLTPLVASADQGDSLHGNAGDDMLFGGSGNDLLDGGAGADVLDGGPGVDTATYAASPTGVTVSLATGHGSGGDAQGDILTDVENLIGSALADTLTGNASSNVLAGGAGGDTLTGRAGADKFVFDATALADAQAATPILDHITDYAQGNSGSVSAAEGDQIDLSALLSAAFGGGQPVSALVRAIESGSGAILQIDTDGAANGANYVTIALLDGLHGGDTVNVILDGALPAGSNIVVAVETAAPTITSNGGGANASVSVAENSTAVTTVAASDPDAGTTLGYTIVGGADAARFQINGATGVLSFVAAPDFETPRDADHNNTYLVQVRVSDGILFDDQAIVVTVTDAVDPLAPVDFTHDAKTDILWRHDSGSVALWTMNGAQKAADQVVSQMGNDWHVLAAADLSGDGRPDILWRHDVGAVALWTMNGAQKVADQVVSNMGNDWHVVETADFNGDGKADILWRHDSGAVALWTMNGAQKAADQVVSPMGNDWHPAATADFNGDGKADILWRHDSGAVALWTMNGAQKVADQVVSAMDNSWQIADTADFNGDGKTDILWRNDSGAVDVWTMNGAQKTEQFVSNLGNDWHFVDTGDFNGDGKADILWRHDSGFVALWTMNGGQKAADQVVSAIGNDWHVLGLGDFNADNKADILWRHDTGAVALWTMNGAQKAADQIVSPMGQDWMLA
jgi:glucose/arabinose dehydrogenase